VSNNSTNYTALSYLKKFKRGNEKSWGAFCKRYI